MAEKKSSLKSIPPSKSSFADGLGGALSGCGALAGADAAGAAGSPTPAVAVVVFCGCCFVSTNALEEVPIAGAAACTGAAATACGLVVFSFCGGF